MWNSLWIEGNTDISLLFWVNTWEVYLLRSHSVIRNCNQKWCSDFIANSSNSSTFEFVYLMKWYSELKRTGCSGSGEYPVNTKHEVEGNKRSQRKSTQTQIALFHQAGASVEPVLPWSLLRIGLHFNRLLELNGTLLGLFLWNVTAETFAGKMRRSQLCPGEQSGATHRAFLYV